MNPDNPEIDPFEQNIISEEQLADMFLDANRSPDIYKKYELGGIMMHANIEDCTNRILGDSTPERSSNALKNLNTRIKDIKINLTNYIGEIYNEIKKYIEGMPKFYIKGKDIYVDYRHDGKSSIQLRIYSGKDTKSAIRQLKSMWKFTNGCFILQFHDILLLIDTMLNIERDYVLNPRAREYRDKYFLTKDRSYFLEIYDKIAYLERKVIDFYDTPDNENDINKMNSMSEKLQDLAFNGTDLLDLAINNFNGGLEKIEEYNILTNKTNSLQKDSDEFKKIWNRIKQYIRCIFRIANYVDTHIGLTQKERDLDNDSYNRELVKRLSKLSSYINKSSII
ncbi:hypothetical protein NEIRO03_1703 [Nematocida sp. AWRm78]|nr:hypothetical protein NEIRO02_1732 [Nematocida sp. AWRm79]KAI5184250.1 hypothetical protein NEIRO03_1703 [Nematocida sp. AWRm78]